MNSKIHHRTPSPSFCGNTEYSLYGSLLSSLLLDAARASIPFDCLGRPPKARWCEEAELAVRDRRRARSEAHRFKTHRLAHVEASWRASSVISRAKAETSQATCSNLLLRSNPVLCSTNSLLNAVAGKKGAFRDPEFPNFQSPKNTLTLMPHIFALTSLSKPLASHVMLSNVDL